MDEQETHLVCPSCGHNDELHLIEDVQVERKLGEVTDTHIEYLDVVQGSEDCYREVGIECKRCRWSYLGVNWRKSLKGVVVNDSPATV